ncbi:MAG: aquaporin [Planctomycetota bacterium]
MKPIVRACIAEFLGTFALLFFGCGSVIVTDGMGDARGVLIAIAFAAVLVVCVTAFFEDSGSQFNPAVSIALVVRGLQPAGRAVLFVVVQLVAAGCGVGMLVYLLRPEVANAESVRAGHAAGSLTVAGSELRLVVAEGLQTFVLMAVILWAIADRPDEPRISHGLCVGLTVAACVVVGGPMTGASLNPARSFGPALYGHWGLHWAYWVGPVGGACLASLVHMLVRGVVRKPDTAS